MKKYLGLDLGQKRDHSALVVVERLERWRPYGPQEFEALLVRHAERIPLGTTYPGVVERVRDVLSIPDLRGDCGLVVDATGVGIPVVEMLRAARLGCEMTAVTITSGEKETGRGSEFHVPKKDLIAGVQLLLERGELKIAEDLRELGTLVEELVDVRRTQRESGRERVGADGSGEHDDLVIALALATWKGARTVKMNNFGEGRLV